MNKYVKYENNIYSSKNDNNNYKYEKLENGLQIFFIEDIKVKISSASMYVKVGNIDNPENIAGLAHFLEHMLFMGSKKYPDVNHFHNLVSTNGGMTNAYTTHNHTYYYFTTSNKFLEILDVFSNFFIEPLFNEKYVEKEVNSVNSEHKKNIVNDSRRVMSLIQEFFIDKNNKKFGCGNYDTLLGNNNIDFLIKNLKKFYYDFYSSEKMILCISHNKIDKLFIDEIKNMFNKIPLKKTKNTNNIPKLLYYKDKYEIIKMKSITKQKTLILNWFIDGYQDYKNNIKDKSFDFLLYILNSSSKNSLYNILINDGLIFSISFSLFETYITHTQLFIEVNLTDEGFKKYKAVINFIILYLENMKNYLKTNIKKMYGEFKNIILLNFISQTKKDNINLIENIINIHNNSNCSFKNILISDILMDKKINNNYYNYLEQLTLQKLKVLLINDEFSEKELTKIDKYYGTNYNIEFNDISKNNNTTINNIYPKLNNYLSKNLKINKYISRNVNKKSKLYKKLESDNIYYIKERNNYKNYNFCANFEIILDDLIKKNVKEYAKLLVHILYIEKLYENEFYNLQISKNIYEIRNIINGLIISINSCNSNDINLFQKFLNFYFNNDNKKINKNIFTNILDELINNINNHYYTQPIEIYKYEFIKTTNINNIITNEELLIELKKMRNNKNEYKFNLKGKIKGIIGGSIKVNKAEEIIKILDKLIKPTNIKNINNYNYNNLVNHKIIKHKIKTTENLIVYGLYIDTKENILLKKCFMRILENYIHEKFFNEMRTEKQLGYIVNCCIININTINCPIYYLLFIIQSSKNNLKNIIEEFINNSYNKYIDKISKNIYKELLNSEYIKLKVASNNINSEIDNKFKNLLELNDFKNNEDFDKNKIMKKIIKSSSANEFIKFAKDIIKDNKITIIEFNKN